MRITCRHLQDITDLLVGTMINECRRDVAITRSKAKTSIARIRKLPDCFDLLPPYCRLHTDDTCLRFSGNRENGISEVTKGSPNLRPETGIEILEEDLIQILS